MPINIVRNHTKPDFDVLKTVGTFTKDTVKGVINNIEDDTTDLEFKSYKESGAINYTEDGIIEVKTVLSLKRIIDNVNIERAKGFHNLSLDAYLKGAGYTKNNGEDFTMKDIYRRMGFNPKINGLQFILDSSKVAGSRELVPEILRGFIQKDLVQEGIWNNLVASERSISMPSEKVPHINYSGEAAAMEEVGEATHTPLGYVSFGSKEISISRKGIGIALTDQVKRFVTVDQLGIYLRDVSRRLSNDLTSDALDVLQNGDQPNFTDPIGVMGVDNIGNKIQYIDYMRMYIRFLRTGYFPSQMICNEEEALRILQVDEFKPSGNSVAARFGLNLGNSGQKDSATLWVHDDIGNHQQVFLDPNNALEYLINEPLVVKEERKEAVETTHYFARMTTGFSNLIQGSKIKMDGTQAFSSTGFPSYLDALK